MQLQPQDDLQLQPGSSKNNKSNVKCWDTLDCLDQYTKPNSKYTGGGCQLPTPTNGGECPPQMQVSAGVSQRWSLYLLWWTNLTSIFDFDFRVKFDQFVRKINYLVTIGVGKGMIWHSCFMESEFEKNLTYSRTRSSFSPPDWLPCLSYFWRMSDAVRNNCWRNNWTVETYNQKQK